MRFSRKYEDVLVSCLRLTIAVVFIWFGALKVMGYNPVFDLIYNSLMPALAHGKGLMGLGVFEILIGLFLLVNRWRLVTHLLLLGHLAGTFTTFVFGWSVVFAPHFPILSLDGEFVIKNMTLAMAGLVVLVHRNYRQ